MPIFTVVVQVVHTRAYQVRADDQDSAIDLVRDEHEMMEYDTLESVVDSIEVTDAN